MDCFTKLGTAQPQLVLTFVTFDLNHIPSFNVGLRSDNCYLDKCLHDRGHADGFGSEVLYKVFKYSQGLGSILPLLLRVAVSVGYLKQEIRLTQPQLKLKLN